MLYCLSLLKLFISLSSKIALHKVVDFYYPFAVSKSDENNENANNTIVDPEKVLEFQMQNEGKHFIYK